MNNSQNSFPRPLIMSEDGKIQYASFENTQTENSQNEGHASEQPKFNIEKLLSQLGKNPNELLSSVLAHNYFGNKKPQMTDLLSNLVKNNSSRQEKSPDDTVTFEDF